MTSSDSPAKFREEWRKALRIVVGCSEGRLAPENEHQTRVSVIDPVLEALGWSFDVRSPHREEHATRRNVNEGTDSEHSVIFLDYLVRDPATGRPQMIIEAKDFSLSSPRPARDRFPEFGRLPERVLVQLGISHLVNERPAKERPITMQWMKWLEQVREYTASTELEHGSAPRRVVVTNGRWILVIKEPKQILLSKAKLPDGAVVFFGENEIFDRYEEIYALLSSRCLLERWKNAITPRELSAYITQSEIERCYQAVAAVHDTDSDPYGPRPKLKLWPVLLLINRAGTIFRVIPDCQESVLCPGPGGAEPNVAVHLKEMKQAHGALLSDVRKYGIRPPRPSALSSFKGFPRLSFDSITGPRSVSFSTDYVGSAGDLVHIVATGAAPHFIKNLGGYKRCQFHSHREAKLQSALFEGAAKTRANRALFGDTDLHHCAHRNVRNPRSRFCTVRDIEDELCCRACVFLDPVCQENFSVMPCPVR